MTAVSRLLIFLLLILGCALGFAQDKVIRANDKIKVVCEEEPALNRDYLVTKDGFVLVSFIGAVKVSGLTEAAAGDALEDELVRQRILKRATVTVTLLTNDTLAVRFSGAVKNPGELAWREGMRLSDITNQAKPLGTADLENIRIESRLGQISTVNFGRFEGTNQTYNPLIKAGDFIFFPLVTRDTKVFVLGAVTKPGAIELKPNMTLGQAITAAGGVLAVANPDRVKLTRTGQADSYLSTRSADVGFKLLAGDRLLVEAISRDKVVIVMGGVKSPGSFGFSEGVTLGRAIQQAGGLADGVKLGKVKLTRRTGERINIRDVDYKKIVEGFQGDITLQAGDRIDVPLPKRSSGGRELIPLGVLLFFLLGG